MTAEALTRTREQQDETGIHAAPQETDQSARMPEQLVIGEAIDSENGEISIYKDKEAVAVGVVHAEDEKTRDLVGQAFIEALKGFNPDSTTRSGRRVAQRIEGLLKDEKITDTSFSFVHPYATSSGPRVAWFSKGWGRVVVTPEQGKKKSYGQRNPSSDWAEISKGTFAVNEGDMITILSPNAVGPEDKKSTITSRDKELREKDPAEAAREVISQGESAGSRGTVIVKIPKGSLQHETSKPEEKEQANSHQGPAKRLGFVALSGVNSIKNAAASAVARIRGKKSGESKVGNNQTEAHGDEEAKEPKEEEKLPEGMYRDEQGNIRLREEAQQVTADEDTEAKQESHDDDQRTKGGDQTVVVATPETGAHRYEGPEGDGHDDENDSSSKSRVMIGVLTVGAAAGLGVLGGYLWGRYGSNPIDNLNIQYPEWMQDGPGFVEARLDEGYDMPEIMNMIESDRQLYDSLLELEVPQETVERAFEPDNYELYTRLAEGDLNLEQIEQIFGEESEELREALLAATLSEDIEVNDLLNNLDVFADLVGNGMNPEVAAEFLGYPELVELLGNEGFEAELVEKITANPEVFTALAEVNAPFETVREAMLQENPAEALLADLTDEASAIDGAGTNPEGVIDGGLLEGEIDAGELEAESSIELYVDDGEGPTYILDDYLDTKGVEWNDAKLAAMHELLAATVGQKYTEGVQYYQLPENVFGNYGFAHTGTVTLDPGVQTILDAAIAQGWEPGQSIKV